MGSRSPGLGQATPEFPRDWCSASMIGHALLVLLGLLGARGSPQLIGHRGVITLREGVEYRDPETVEASESVAHFAKEFQEVDDAIAERLSRTNNFRSPLNEVTPKFPAQVLENVRGRPLVENEIFDYLDTRFVEPAPEQQFNQFLDEVEIERATSPIRLLPGEGLPPTPRPPTRPPNRLVNLQRPSLGSQESVRSQNSRFPTVFGPPSNNNIIPGLRPGANLDQNTFLDSNQLADRVPSAGFAAVPPPLTNTAAALPQDASGPHMIRPFVNLNAGSMYLTQPEPATLQIPQPVFATHADTTAGFADSPAHQSLGPPSPPLIHEIGGSFHQEAGISHGSFHQDIGAPIGHLSEFHPASQEISSQYGAPGPRPVHGAARLQYQDPLFSQAAGGGFTSDSGPRIFGASPSQEISSQYGAPGPRAVHGAARLHYQDPLFSQAAGVGFSPDSAPQIFGASPEFNQPFVNSLHSGGHGVSQLHTVGGASHSFSEGPHHSLSIQHLH